MPTGHVECTAVASGEESGRANRNMDDCVQYAEIIHCFGTAIGTIPALSPSSFISISNRLTHRNVPKVRLLGIRLSIFVMGIVWKGFP